MSAHFREADPARAVDVAVLAGLRRAWTEEQSGAAADPDFETRFGSWLAAESVRRRVFLAEDSGVALGMANLAVFERMPRPVRAPSRWAYLANVFVMPGHRDEGVGAGLLDHVVGVARDLGCVRVVLAPSERSVPFYVRAGFGPAAHLLSRELAPDATPPEDRG